MYSNQWQRLEAIEPDRPTFHPRSFIKPAADRHPMNQAGALPRAEWPSVRGRPRDYRPPHLTKAQFAAIEDAIRRAAWARHPLHISLKLRLFRKRYYLALIGGEDRRQEAREDTNSHGRWGQAVMIIGLAVLLFAGGLIGVHASVFLTSFMTT